MGRKQTLVGGQSAAAEGDDRKLLAARWDGCLPTLISGRVVEEIEPRSAVEDDSQVSGFPIKFNADDLLAAKQFIRARLAVHRPTEAEPLTVILIAVRDAVSSYDAPRNRRSDVEAFTKVEAPVCFPSLNTALPSLKGSGEGRSR